MGLWNHSKPLHRRLWLPLMCALVATAASYVAFRYFSASPRYSATATVLVGSDIPSREADWSSFQTGRNLLPTYVELARRPPVTQRVVEALGLSESAKELSESISVSVVDETQLIEISVTDNDATRAANVANEVARQLVERAPISAPPGFVRITERAEARLLRPAVASYIAVVLGGISGLVLGIGGALLLEYFDDRIWAPGDVAEGLRLPTLGAVNYFSGARRGRLLGWLQRRPEKEREVAAKRRVSRRRRKSRVARLRQFAGLARLLPARRAQRMPKKQRRVPVTSGLLGMVGQLWAGGLRAFAGLRRLQPRGRGEKEPEASALPLSRVADACRLLSINMSHLQERPWRKVLITGSGPGEGSSTVAVGLAAALAEAGQKVVLVDAHVRSPRLHDWFSLQNDIGLMTLLKYDSADDQVIAVNQWTASTDWPNLAVMVSGRSNRRSSACLASPRLQAVLEVLGLQADVVVIDAPPALSGSDAAILASKVDSILLVLRPGKTRLKAAKEAAEMLTKAGGTILGVALLSSTWGDDSTGGDW